MDTWNVRSGDIFLLDSKLNFGTTGGAGIWSLWGADWTAGLRTFGDVVVHFGAAGVSLFGLVVELCSRGARGVL